MSMPRSLAPRQRRTGTSRGQRPRVCYPHRGSPPRFFLLYTNHQWGNTAAIPRVEPEQRLDARDDKNSAERKQPLAVLFCGICAVDAAAIFALESAAQGLIECRQQRHQQ
jgi:hypothetical protein